MPERHSSAAEAPKTAQFAGLAAVKADEIRDCVNIDEMTAWLEQIAQARLGGEPNERKAKARVWLMGVGRRSVIRKGAATPYAPKRSETAPEWAQKALAEGKTLLRLTLGRAEANELGAICDWLKSDAGPTLDSDWSRVSRPQAREAERAWLRAIAKQAKKNKDEAQDAAGTSHFTDIPGAKWEGWRWVSVKSKAALNREGELMGHCVGSYAEEVEEGGVKIYSLRDPKNKPKLTVEARDNELEQLKAFANEEAGPEWAPPAGAFLKAYVKKTHRASDLYLSEDWDNCGAKILPWGDAWVLGEELSSEEQKAKAARARAWGKDARNKSRLEDELTEEALYGRLDFVKELMTANPSQEVAARVLAYASEADESSLKKWGDLLLPLLDKKSMAFVVGCWMDRDDLSIEDEEQLGKMAEAVPMDFPDSHSVIVKAARRGKVEMLNTLLGKATTAEEKVLDEAMTQAMFGKSVECVQALINARARLSLKPISNKTKESILWAGINSGMSDAVLLDFMPKKMSVKSNLFLLAVQQGRTGLVKVLMPLASEDQLSEAFVGACQFNQAHVVRLLGPLVSKQKRCEGLMQATRRDHLGALKELVKLVDEKAELAKALNVVAGHGSAAMAKVLLSVASPAANGHEALLSACLRGKTAVALELAKHCENKSVRARAMAIAAEAGKTTVAVALAKGASLEAIERAIGGAFQRGYSVTALALWDSEDAAGLKTASESLAVKALASGAEKGLERVFTRLDSSVRPERLALVTVGAGSIFGLRVVLEAFKANPEALAKVENAVAKDEWRTGRAVLEKWKEEQKNESKKTPQALRMKRVFAGGG